MEIGTFLWIVAVAPAVALAVRIVRQYEGGVVHSDRRAGAMRGAVPEIGERRGSEC